VSYTVRPATAADVPALGELAAAMVAHHHALDPKRFFTVQDLAPGYGRFLGERIADPRAVVLVADVPELGAAQGYAYGCLEERDWNALLDEHGALHDVYILPAARRRGLARALAQAMFEQLGALGASRLVLSTAAENHGAQALFASLGFRRTMIEWSRDA
jgi:ribosomal protein S18 acetylase RimI-like enzyme